MRVIAGTAKGVTLYAPGGRTTRPTADRTRQKLFDTLQSLCPLPDMAIDVFAGTGSLGIEALSRGVERVTFVDSSRAVRSTLLRNLEKTHLIQRAEVYITDVFLFIRRYHSQAFPLIFADPPYNQGLAQKLIDILSADNSFWADDGLLVIEESNRVVLQLPDNTECVTQKKSGDSALYFIKKMKRGERENHSPVPGDV